MGRERASAFHGRGWTEARAVRRASDRSTTAERPATRTAKETERLGSGQRRWLVASALLLVLGTIGSTLGAQALAHNQGQRSSDDFKTTAMEIASTFRLDIQHEQDLVIGAGAFIAQDPTASQAEFTQWTRSVQAFDRYPEVVGIAHLAMVPAAQLNAFAAQASVDPAGPLSANGTFVVTPAGARPYYCLATVSVSRTGPSTTPAGFDYCATELGPSLLEARDTGQPAYLPYGSGDGVQLVLGAPIYRTGAPVGTVDQRRQAFLGWTGTSTVPNVILKTAIDHHPSTAMAVSHGTGSSRVTLRTGTVPAGAHSTTIDLHNGWDVEVYGLVGGGSIIDNGNAIGLLLGGTALFTLLAAMIFVLATSRSRALLLVRERTEQLRHQAFHDALTGLPNRALILDRMDQMLARSRRTHHPMAAMFLDLDNFKDINDTLGHDAGDQLLVEVAKRLAGALRHADTVGRLGGDEFIVLVDGSSLAAGAEAAADRLLGAFGAPFHIAGAPALSVTASIGIATGDVAAADELLRDADIALYRAKSAGKNCAAVFSPSMQQAVDDHRDLDVDLHRALDAGQFFLLYQPVVDLPSGRMTGVEALLRWHHPERGIVPPEAFIEELESSGLIVPVGNWVLQEACRQGARWQRNGHPLVVSVNVAAAQLERDRIVDDVHGALNASGLDPTLLTLELTESALMRNMASTVARLELLKAIGVRIAIDDFGTGYSSMAYLQQLPIDILKIDQSFVSHLGDSAESAALVHTLVQLAKTLGISSTAEGIESEEQQIWLQNEGVESGQGFLYSRPVPAEDLAPLLERPEDHPALLAAAP